MTRRFGVGVGGAPGVCAVPGSSHGLPPLPPPPTDTRHMQRVLKTRPGCESRSTSSGATYEGGDLCQSVGVGVGAIGERGAASFAPDPPPQLPLPQTMPLPHPQTLPLQQTLPRRGMYVYQQTTVPYYEDAGHGGPRVRPVARACSNTSLSGASSCSARCEAFSNCCYYFFQVVLSVGLLGGISLLIAVCVLRGQAWNRDLSSLPYIGFVLVAVCSGLLAVQINAHRSKHRRKINTRPGGGVVTVGRTAASDLIPLQRIGAMPGTSVATSLPHRGMPNSSAPPLELMYQPLLPPGRTTMPRHLVEQEMVGGSSGPPWWRRNGTPNDRMAAR